MTHIPKVTTVSDSALALYRTDQRYRTGRLFIKWCGAVACFYFFSVAIAPFAGKDTAVSLVLSVLADFKFAITIALSGAACAWAVVERILRERKTQYLQDRIKKLETKIDDNRSSSNLTRKGKTNPNDRRS